MCTCLYVILFSHAPTIPPTLLPPKKTNQTPQTGGAGGTRQVKRHPFFKPTDWAAILNKRHPPPIRPCRPRAYDSRGDSSASSFSASDSSGSGGSGSEGSGSGSSSSVASCSCSAGAWMHKRIYKYGCMDGYRPHVDTHTHLNTQPTTNTPPTKTGASASHSHHLHHAPSGAGASPPHRHSSGACAKHHHGGKGGNGGNGGEGEEEVGTENFEKEFTDLDVASAFEVRVVD